MSRFPNGRPEHLLGSLACPPPAVSDAHSRRQESNADDDFDWDPMLSPDEEDNASDESDGPLSKAGSKKRVRDPSSIPVGRRNGKPKPKVPWIAYDVVRGWAAVESLFTIFSHQCDCTPVVSRNGHASSYSITYRFECGYGNRIGCKWQCQVVIYYDQPAAGRRYLRNHPQAESAPGFQPLDCQVYNRQTLFAVKQDMRPILHANHICMVATAFVHSNHTGYVRFGAHCMWEAFCRMHAYALNFKRHEIQQWLEDRNINVTHESMNKQGVLVRTNQMGVMVDRCKRFAERYRKAAENDTHVNSGYEGKLLALCEKYCFAETARRLGHMHFDTNTPYILPGWSSCQDDRLPPGGFVVLMSTMNLALNLARAHKWYAGNVTVAVDHTFKVICHPLCPVVWPPDPLPSCRWTATVIRTYASMSWLPTKARTGFGPPVRCAVFCRVDNANCVGCMQQYSSFMGCEKQHNLYVGSAMHNVSSWAVCNINQRSWALQNNSTYTWVARCNLCVHGLSATIITLHGL